MTDETSIDASQEKTEQVWVNLAKNVYEKNGRNLISYKPVSKTGKTYPIWLGRFDETKEQYNGKEVINNMYDDKYRLSIAVNENKENNKGDLVITLNKVETDEYKKYYLIKKSKDGKVSFGVEKPIEIGGTSYWINLYQHTPTAEKPHIMFMIFAAAEWSTWGSVWTESEITFGDVDF